jgi:hypothetical protein
MPPLSAYPSKDRDRIRAMQERLRDLIEPVDGVTTRERA